MRKPRAATTGRTRSMLLNFMFPKSRSARFVLISIDAPRAPICTWPPRMIPWRPHDQSVFPLRRDDELPAWELDARRERAGVLPVAQVLHARGETQGTRDSQTGAEGHLGE